MTQAQCLFDEPQGKRCTKCQEFKLLDQFGVRGKGRLGRQSWCRVCKITLGRDWNKTEQGLEWRKNYILKKTYGLSKDDFDAMLAAQGGVCAICKKPEQALDFRTKKSRHLCVDHDHETGLPRGLLCVSCNRGVGSFYDDPSLLIAAAAYLKKLS